MTPSTDSYNASRRKLAATAAFFLRIGQVKTVTERRCEWTAPLFPLALILDADGTLAQAANPQATPAEYQAAMTRLARECGV